MNGKETKSITKVEMADDNPKMSGSERACSRGWRPKINPGSSICMRVAVLMTCLYVLYLLSTISSDLTEMKIYERQNLVQQKLYFSSHFDDVVSSENVTDDDVIS